MIPRVLALGRRPIPMPSRFPAVTAWRSHRVWFACIAFMAMTATPGRADWSDEFGPAGVDGEVHATLVREGQIYVGGAFVGAGSANATNVARFDGRRWHAMGDGTDGPVVGFVIHDKALHAFGHFTRAGLVEASGLARWDTDRWWAVPGVDGPVTASVSTATGLVIADGAGRLVRLTSSSSEPLPGTPDGRVHALAVLDGRLVAGGAFRQVGEVAASNIAIHTANGWQPLGDGLDAPVRALGVGPSGLVAGGLFERSGSIELDHLAWWDGDRWQPLPGSPGDVVEVVHWHGASLVAGGWVAPGAGRGLVAGWSELQPVLDQAPDGPIQALASDGGDLIVGGHFSRLGTSVRHGLFRVHDGAIESIGDGSAPDGFVHALSPHRGGVAVGGQFTHVGSRSMPHVAWWSGEGFEPLGGGTDRIVWSLATHDGRLVAGGEFMRAGDVEANHVAAFEGETWHPLGDGLDGSVHALASHRGRLVAGGTFTRSGGRDVTSLAAWNGTTWEPFAGGADGDVHRLVVLEDELWVLGLMDRVGDTPARFVARHDGNRWDAPAPGLDAPAYSMTRWQGRVVLGGAFGSVDGVRAGLVAVEDGSRWRSIGDGLLPGARDSERGIVQSVAVVDDVLVAAGGFMYSGARVVPRVAWFDGQMWQPLGGGLDGRATDMIAFDDGVVLGGRFQRAGDQRSVYLARWRGAPR